MTAKQEVVMELLMFIVLMRGLHVAHDLIIYFFSTFTFVIYSLFTYCFFFFSFFSILLLYLSLVK